MSRLTLVELACILAIGIAMVEMGGERHTRLVDNGNVPALAAVPAAPPAADAPRSVAAPQEARGNRP